MVTPGQQRTRPAPAPLGAGVGTCALSATDLAADPARPRRLPYHLLVLTTAGHGTVEIDFVAHRCRPGTLLWVRPGQAVRFGAGPGLDAALVTWHRDLLAAAEITGVPVDDLPGPARWQLAGEDEDAILSEVAQLGVDCARHRSGAIAAGLLRHQVAVLLLRIALLDDGARAVTSVAEARTFVRFRRDLEAGHAQSRRVEDYAARIGCSVRTLTRASLALTGRTAKQVVDDRVALEARRLLACTELSVAEIGRRLGFGEPTNFGRFFHREAGMSPGAFRAWAAAAETPAGVPQPAAGEGSRVPAPRPAAE
ncbi:helix-turn-helix domain-containing protein [Couchioplanes azureus]|uniref:helix-turn-helix domain-containing protein n=1 Tax=Couchioplanes caeruleus TaxID=56438 RepID=UPI001670F499|nr:helix-turn-helix domain-containing protein [Couchioplanes caeruleus]GGQ55292.1 AraC family transcriptional regulator [Couchioplanes caeruleus subsp. azureus]